MAIDLENKKKSPETYSESTGSSTSKTTQQSTTGNVLDQALVDQIMSGLTGQVTDEEIQQFAENLLRPTLNASLEAAQQNYETTKLSREQEIENLASTLARSIQEQQNAYKTGTAQVETAALQRGMGRSSYTMQTLAGLSNSLGEAVRQLTEDNARQQNQIQQQITQAAQQNAQTSGRLNTDYATQLAAKVQELRQNQQSAYNQNYMTAVSGAMGSKTDYTSETTGSENSMSVAGKITDPNEDSGSSEKKKSTTANTIVSGLGQKT